MREEQHVVLCSFLWINASYYYWDGGLVDQATSSRTDAASLPPHARLRLAARWSCWPRVLSCP